MTDTAGITIGSSGASTAKPVPVTPVNGALQLQQFCCVEKLLAPQEAHNRLSVDIVANRYDVQAQRIWNLHLSEVHLQSESVSMLQSTSQSQ